MPEVVTRNARARAWRRGNSLAGRLAMSYVAIALMSIAVLTGLAAAVAATDVAALQSRQRAVTVSALTAAAAAAWDKSGGWASAPLSPALNLAARTGADAQIRTVSGRVVAVTPGFGGRPSSQQTSRIIRVQGRPVGVLFVRFGTPSTDMTLRNELLQALIGAAALAAVFALVTGLLAARTITRPFGQIIRTTKAMGLGDRSARVGQVRAPAEMRDLASAIDQMADALEQHERIRRDFVADVAHELRTPVAVLQAELEALQDNVVEPRPDQIGSLRDEVLRLARALDDLQSVASADASALHLARRRCDLADIAASAADSLALRFDAAGLTLGPQLMPVEVLGDAGRLQQIVANLLTNALKYTQRGGRVTIRTARAGPTEAVLEVTDNGVGIAPEELPRIFDRFWRGRQAAQTTSGSGIGLAVAAELARAHGGQLSAESEPGRGTQMTLTLPAA